MSSWLSKVGGRRSAAGHRLVPRFPPLGVLVAATIVAAFVACARLAASAEPRQVLDVFAAASLAEPFAEIGNAFAQTEPGVAVRFNFGGSNQLRAQLDQGARADLFAPASEVEMQKADQAGLIDGKAVGFAHNRLIVALPRANPAGIERLADLGRPGVKIDVAGPNVPVGAYTRKMLARLSADPAFGPGFRERVLANVVSDETDVRQVVTKVRLGEVDAGVVYVSDVTPKSREEIAVLDVPDRFNVVATYPIAVTKAARHPALARRFVEFVRSEPGQATLERYGFEPVR